MWHRSHSLQYYQSQISSVGLAYEFMLLHCSCNMCSLTSARLDWRNSRLRREPVDGRYRNGTRAHFVYGCESPLFQSGFGPTICEPSGEWSIPSAGCIGEEIKSLFDSIIFSKNGFASLNIRNCSRVWRHAFYVNKIPPMNVALKVGLLIIKVPRRIPQILRGSSFNHWSHSNWDSQKNSYSPCVIRLFDIKDTAPFIFVLVACPSLLAPDAPDGYVKYNTSELVSGIGKVPCWNKSWFLLWLFSTTVFIRVRTEYLSPFWSVEPTNSKMCR